MEDDCFTVINESLREPHAASETGTSSHLQFEEEWTVTLVMQHVEHMIISKLPLFGSVGFGCKNWYIPYTGPSVIQDSPKTEIKIKSK